MDEPGIGFFHIAKGIVCQFVSRLYDGVPEHIDYALHVLAGGQISGKHPGNGHYPESDQCRLMHVP